MLEKLDFRPKCDGETENGHSETNERTSALYQKSVSIADVRTQVGDVKLEQAADTNSRISIIPEFRDQKLRVFNRELIPSKNYFFDVPDLMQRIKGSRTMRKVNFIETDFWREGIQAFGDNTSSKDNNDGMSNEEACSRSSHGILDSQNQKSLKTFEPPILYGKKPRYVGIVAQ